MCEIGNQVVVVMERNYVILPKSAINKNHVILVITHIYSERKNKK